MKDILDGSFVMSTEAVFPPVGGPVEQEEGVSSAAPSSASPFLADTHLQFAWDSTSLGWFKECPRKYFYHMIEGWRSGGDLNVHLRFGQLYHASLELYDKLRMVEKHHHETALAAVVYWLLQETWDKGKPWTPDHNTKTRPNLIRTVVWYLEQFRDDPAQTIQLSNGKPAVELSFRMELDIAPSDCEPWRWLPGNQPYVLCGHLDRLVEFAGQTYVMDRKTTGSTISGHFFDGFNPDNQMSLYTLAAQVIYKVPVKGVIIDGAQIAVGFSRFERGFTYRTQGQLQEWLKDTQYHLDRAANCASEDYWPTNDKSCNNYGGCVFRKICSKDPAVRERFLESDFIRIPWNPLEPR